MPINQEKLQQKIETINKQIEDLEQHKEKTIEKYTVELNDISNQIDTLTRKKNSINGTMEHIQSELDNLEEDELYLDVLTADDLQQQVDEFEEQLDDIKSELSTIENKKNRKIKKLQKEIQETQEKRDKLEGFLNNFLLSLNELLE